jgi:hypothetical protein
MIDQFFPPSRLIDGGHTIYFSLILTIEEGKKSSCSLDRF